MICDYCYKPVEKGKEYMWEGNVFCSQECLDKARSQCENWWNQLTRDEYYNYYDHGFEYGYHGRKQACTNQAFNQVYFYGYICIYY